LKCYSCTTNYDTKEARNECAREYYAHFEDTICDIWREQYAANIEKTCQRASERCAEKHPKALKSPTKHVNNETDTVFVIDGNDIPLSQYDAKQLEFVDLNVKLLRELVKLHDISPGKCRTKSQLTHLLLNPCTCKHYDRMLPNGEIRKEHVILSTKLTQYLNLDYPAFE
jgi:hypothetical protein